MSNLSTVCEHGGLRRQCVHCEMDRIDEGLLAIKPGSDRELAQYRALRAAHLGLGTENEPDRS